MATGDVSITVVAVRMPKIDIRDHRCPYCGKLLFRAHIPQGVGVVIEIRCKCGRMTVIDGCTNCDESPA
jgi:hypothetical protein